MIAVVVLALAAALCNSIFSLTNRWTVVRWHINPLVASLIVQAFSGLLAALAILLFHIRWQHGATWEMVAVGGISMVAFSLMMISFQREDASAVAPILGLKVIFVAIIEPFLLGHAVGFGVPAGAVVSVAGIMLSSQTDRWSLHPRDIWRPGIAIMVASALLFAICDLLVKRSLQIWHGDSLGVALYLVNLSGVLAFLLLPLASRAVRKDTATAESPSATGLSHSVFIPVLISAVMWFLMQYFIFSAFSRNGAVTLPNIIYNSRNLMVVLLAALLVLGRKSTIEQARSRAYAYRTLGALATISAIALALFVK